MKEPNLEELQRSGALRDLRTGAFVPFANREFHYLRHAQNISAWERVLGLIAIGLILFALFNVIVGALGFTPPL